MGVRLPSFNDEEYRILQLKVDACEEDGIWAYRHGDIDGFEKAKEARDYWLKELDKAMLRQIGGN